MKQPKEQKQPEYVAVPMGLFNLVYSILAKLPYEQVVEVLTAMQLCQPMNMVEKEDANKPTDK